MFEKILIANRGEIALRILRTCRRLGVRAAAVYSEADSRSMHRLLADEAVQVGAAPAGQSYLVKERIIEAALSTRCQAIHPGYGFLAENPDFARMTREAGLAFIGPSAAAIAILGDKLASKNLAVRAGVPVIPGPLAPLSDAREVIAAAAATGYPILLKPVMGGGGKGMRIVAGREEAEKALAVSRNESGKAFGDTQIFLERYLPDPRHIEVQILADEHGNVVWLGERECSVQRRHQKVIEETPSTAIDDSMRQAAGRMACALAREAGYTNAGTVEFILDPESGGVCFLEMNTRLQVEHAVTEMVTSLDLVELQLRVACGERLPFRQEEVGFHGWAIEARVCAEDPERGYLPSTGIVTRYFEPRGRHIRVDSGIQAGSVVSPYYDSLLAKVISWGEDREEARRTLVRALNSYHIEGVATNVHFINAILNHPAFVKGDLSTGFIDRHFERGQMKISPPVRDLHYMATAATLVYHNRRSLVRESLKPMAAHVGGAPASKPWCDYMVKGDEDVFEVRLRQVEPSPDHWEVRVNGTDYRVVTPRFEFYRRRLKLEIDGEVHRFILHPRVNFTWAAFNGITRTLEIYSPLEWKLTPYVPLPPEKRPENVLPSPMPGMIVDIRVREGERVYRGQELVAIESMKMESGVAAPRDAVVEKVMVRPGQAVDAGDVLFVFGS
ncbi:MAG: biotin carboxylase N-terminal domain-containing protein [bacterium]